MLRGKCIIPLGIKRIVNAPIDSNCYIIYDKSQSEECIIIDPGSEHNVVLINFLAQNSLIPKFIILTHEHFDHCWGVNDLRERYPKIRIICSTKCSETIQDPRATYSRYYCKPEFVIAPADILLEFVQWKVYWNNYQFFFSAAKGHSASGIYIFIENAVFTGDTLVKDMKTTTKFKTGSIPDLKLSLQNLSRYKGHGLMVYPGHGDSFDLDKCDLSEAF